MHALDQHIDNHGLRGEDLLLHLSMFTQPQPGRPALIDAEQLGETEPNAEGRTYRHGTLSASTAGRCRCPRSRAAFATYRARRRENGLDQPAAHEPSSTATGTCPVTGGAPKSGRRPAPPRNCTRARACTTTATPTPPGCSPAAPTSRPSKTASATGPSQPPRNNSTLCPTPTTPH